MIEIIKYGATNNRPYILWRSRDAEGRSVYAATIDDDTQRQREPAGGWVYSRKQAITNLLDERFANQEQ